ncbi:L-seryl-tRNA(Sec) selenium transferase [Fodinisporobacter ferrooxydans]|uniref:L-seryl-tRNA(Sec) selenium transferase n=1 Tax=Fodinisporobacter ferrooxydans TaxID=2901836 RepID=A0ABY4CE51_9BACL|nr:L-seryl-tRNA(Sec) selenium transferase [Alicyclobacillaceae bacterium MYW30-H2]
MDQSQLHVKLRHLPAVHKVLSATSYLEEQYPFALRSEVAAQTIAEIREQLVNGCMDEVPTIERLIDMVQTRLQEIQQMHYRPVINATGVILHTNLGRAPLAHDAVRAIVDTAGGYSNLEYRLEEGRRGSRYEHVEQLLCKLTGAEAAFVVNNNAAAVFLVLREMATDREVIISRGQIVEIGGSFRISEVMRESGGKLVEVGTTNKTHLYDYERAITPETALLLRVHTSNFRIIGFTEEPELSELVSLSKEKHIPLYEDLGSGCLIDLAPFGVSSEPTVAESIRAGVDIVSFSGDKLLGGAQAGIVVGKAEYIKRLKRNQLTRALRVDKLTLAALEATLKLYLTPEQAVDKIPTLWLMKRPVADIQGIAMQLQERFLESGMNERLDIQVVPIQSQIGGGSLPGEELPSYGLQLESRSISLTDFEYELRNLPLPIIARFHKDALIFDLRTVFPEQIDAFVKGCEDVYGKLCTFNYVDR